MKNKFEKLKIENNDQKINTKKTLDTFDNISAESKRVSKIALNANIIYSVVGRPFGVADQPHPLFAVERIGFTFDRPLHLPGCPSFK